MLKISDGRLLIIYGPTATGKTSLATRFAKKFNCELISADSRQVYKGLDIGSGKLSREQFNNSTIQQFEGYWIVDGVKIHGFDLLKPPGYEPGSRKVPSGLEPGSRSETFTAFDFLKFAHSSMIQIMKSNKLPIIVGGTGFYIKALIDGIDSIGIPSDPKLRSRLEKLSVDQLYQKLIKLDSVRAKAMNESDRQNPRRLIRAIEIAIAPTSEESEPTSEVNKSIEIAQAQRTPGVSKFASEYTPGVSFVIGLTAPNDYLYNRADKWLETRLERGMINEVQNLVKKGVNPVWLENIGLEYRWLTRYLTGQIEKDQAVERLKGDIHSLIRRQKTWFKKFPSIRIYDISKSSWPHELEKTVKDWYNGAQ